MNKNTLKKEFLAWDSEFWGVITERITIDCLDKTELGNALKDSRAQLIYFFDNTLLPVTDEYLRSLGAVKYDTKTIFHKKYFSPVNDDLEAEVYSGKLNDDLEQLAYIAGHMSRFKKDVKLAGKFRQLYKIWIQNAVDRGKSLLVIRVDNKIKAFLSFNIAGNEATIELIAVHPDCAGQGLGKSLYKSFESYVYQRGVNVIKVVTQGDNLPACRFYEKMGLRLYKTQNVYHLWRENV